MRQSTMVRCNRWCYAHRTATRCRCWTKYKPYPFMPFKPSAVCSSSFLFLRREYYAFRSVQNPTLCVRSSIHGVLLDNSKQNLKSLMAGVYWRHGETLIINIRKTPIRTEASVEICTQKRDRVGAVPTWHAQKSWAYHQVSSSTSTHPPSEWQTINSQHAQMCFWWLGPSS